MGNRILVLSSKVAYSNNNFLLQHLKEKGWNLFVQIVPSYNILKYLALIPSFSLDVSEWRNNAAVFYEKMHKSPWVFLKRTKFCKNIIKQLEGKIDLILQFYGMFMPTDDFKSLNIPYVVFNDYSMKLAEKYSPWLPFNSQLKRWYELETTLYKNSSFNFTWSENTRQSLIRDYGVNENKVIVTERGIKLNKVLCEKQNFDNKIVLFVGNDFRRKGGFVLLEAFKKVSKVIPDAKLIIVGPRKEALKVNDVGIEILGKIDNQEQLISLYEQASIFVMPSLCEPFGLVFLEAMAYKLPCIGTNVDAMPEIIEDGKTGFIVPPGNPIILAEKIISLLNSQRLMQEMGEAGYARLTEKFNWDKAIEKIDSNLRRII
jgi:glycosyltransferase involved in cell wall biosynthesis